MKDKEKKEKKRRAKAVKAPAFRLSAKRIFLTYSQTHPDLEIRDVIDAMKGKEELPPFQYIVAKEKHEDGGSHFHVLLVAKKKFDIRKANVLDFKFKDKLEHGNYARVRNLERAVEYACKDQAYETDMENVFEGKLASLKDILIKQVLLKGRAQALLEFFNDFPKASLGSVTLTSANRHFIELAGLEAARNADLTATPFKLSDFAIPPVLQAWMERPTRTLLLAGESGCGKTSFAMAFCKERKLKTLVVNEVQDLRRLEPHHEAIIFDDANIESLTETQLLSLISTEANKTLRVLYGTVIKKAGLTQVVLLNFESLEKVRRTLIQERFARRITYVVAPTPFVMNLSIQVNNYFGADRDEEAENMKRSLSLLKDGRTGDPSESNGSR